MREPVLEVPSDSEEDSGTAGAGWLAVLRISVQSQTAAQAPARVRGVMPLSDAEEDGALEEPPFIVEDDLQVQDICDFDLECDEPAPSIPWYSTGLRLMEARSQSCVVCLSDKKHTFVPQHVHTHSGKEPGSAQVQSHRLCTDCWVTFLRHGAECGLPALRCPVCRCDIDVPDVWCVSLGLEHVHAQETASTIAASVVQPSSESDLITSVAPPASWAEKRASESPLASSSSTPRAVIARSADSLPALEHSSAGIISSPAPEQSRGGDARRGFGAIESWCTRGCCEMLRHDANRRAGTPRSRRSGL